MKILFLSRWYPFPADNGSKIRVRNILRQLAIEHEVSLASFRGNDDWVGSDEWDDELGQLCREVRAVPYRSFRPSSTTALLGLLSPQPRLFGGTHSQPMVEAVAEQFRRIRPDVVIASQIDMIPYAVRLAGVPLVLEELELTTFFDAASAGRPLPRRARAWMTWLKLRAFLRRTLPRFSACTVVSVRERELARHVVGPDATIRIIPNAVDSAEYTGDFGSCRPNTMIFSGALTYSPNFDAARHFVNEIYPEVRRAVSDVELQITGSQAGIDPTTLPRDAGVKYTGYLKDIRPSIAQSWLSVVPLRRGGGTRLKILESMALGTPVVSTSKGAEGLDVTDRDNILIADDPRAFAQRVVELLHSPGLRGRLAAAGRGLIDSTYNWRVVGADLRALVEQAAQTTGKRA